MKFIQLPIIAAMSALIAVPSFAFAEGELEEAELFFELNDTDGDLGIHGFADGDAWKELEIEAPNDRELMEIDVRSRLKRQGVTELFFESAEPCFPTAEDCDPDEALDPAKFFKRFPEGIYEIEVETLDNEELENEVYLSQIIPAAPVVSLNGLPSAPRDVCQCDEEELEEGEVCPPLPIVTDGAVLSWDPVTSSHATLGNPGAVTPIYYEVVVEIDETPFKSTSIVPPEVHSWELPEGILELSDEIKYEVLVRVDNGYGNPGNKSAMESCFEVAE